MSEADLVKTWRDRGFSWQAIANNMRRNVEDVRRDHDRGYAPQFAKPERKDRLELRVRGRPEGAQRKTVIGTLLRSTDPVPGDLMGDSTAVANIVRDLRRKYGQEAILNTRNLGYWLSPEGRQALQRDYGWRL